MSTCLLTTNFHSRSFETINQPRATNLVLTVLLLQIYLASDTHTQYIHYKRYYTREEAEEWLGGLAVQQTWERIQDINCVILYCDIGFI